jgi:glycine/D-amino acid oxidase-like deaminating enzyme
LSGGYPFRALPAGTTAVVERHSGYFSPAALRAAVLAQLANHGVAIREAPVTGLDAAPGVRLADGTIADYDVVVVAAGAWTPALLAANGLRGDGLSTRQIQYSVFPAAPAGLGAFVDDTTGLYGRPADGGGFQLGLPCDRCDVDPARLATDTGLVERVAARASSRLGLPSTGPHRTVASSDCYHDPPGLALRPTGAAAIHTFTGGSGGAAKTVLAVSRTVATALLAG